MTDEYGSPVISRGQSRSLRLVLLTQD